MKRDQRAKNQLLLRENKRINPQNVLWTQTVTTNELVEIATNLKTIVKERAPFKTEYARNNCVGIYNMCSEKLVSADRTRFTELQSHIYYLLWNQLLPTLINQIRTNIWSFNHEDTAAEVFRDTLINVMNVHVDHFPRKVAPSRQQNIENPSQEPTALKDKDAQKALSDVNSLLKTVNKYTTTTEDQFLLQQIASSYLPEAVKLYQGLSNSPKNMQQEVKNIFLKQLAIITVQLESIHDTGAQQQLSKMKAHLEFLETKQNMKL